MKAKISLREVFISIISIAPFLYYLYLWDTLPDMIPMHFDIEGNPDNYGSRNIIGLGLLFFNVGFYYFFKYIPKIYKRNSFTMSEKTFDQLRLILALFFSALFIIITHSIEQAEVNNTFIFISIALLISLLGNYMRNVRPNHLPGNRFFWTNKDESSWKKTQNFIGLLWFFTGIILVITILILPEYLEIYVFAIGIVAAMLVIPAVYSFIIYLENRKSISKNIETKHTDHWVGLFYVNRNDKRILVPKRVIGMGWTINFGNPYSYLLIIAIVLIIIISNYLF